VLPKVISPVLKGQGFTHAANDAMPELSLPVSSAES
jgi:hypothetical protein